MPDTSAILDNLLDRTVLLSFTNLGYFLRRPFWKGLSDVCLKGKRVAVTGGSSGIGFETARWLTASGASVCILSRSEKRLSQAMGRIREEVPGSDIHAVAVDMGIPESIDRAVDQLRGHWDIVDALVLNAGILPRERVETDWGLEKTAAVNLFGPHRFMLRLLPVLQESEDPRVLLVSSGGMYPVGLDVDGLMNPPEPFDGVRAYARTKRAQVELARLCGNRLPAPVRFASLHPGWVRTPGLKESLPVFYRVMYSFLRTRWQGADTICWLLTIGREEFGNGNFWFDRRVRDTVRFKNTAPRKEERERLWETVTRLGESE